MKYVLAFTLVISLSLFSKESELCADSYSEFIQPKGTICAGWEFGIEPDMQITDNDLTLNSAKESLTWLNKNLDKHGFLFKYGKVNSLKIVQGYIFKSGYLNSHPNDKKGALKNYCNWLKIEGFWYD